MTNAEARFNNSLRPRKPEGSLGRTAQDGHLDSHTAPELCKLPPTQKAPLNGSAPPHYTATRVLCIKRLYTRIALRGSGWRFVADGFQNVHCTRIAFTRKGVDLRRMILIFSAPVSLL